MVARSAAQEGWRFWALSYGVDWPIAQEKGVGAPMWISRQHSGGSARSVGLRELLDIAVRRPIPRVRACMLASPTVCGSRQLIGR